MPEYLQIPVITCGYCYCPMEPCPPGKAVSPVYRKLRLGTFDNHPSSEATVGSSGCWRQHLQKCFLHPPYPVTVLQHEGP